VLDRILATPQLARVVPQLQPQVLHRIIQHCGLEDCRELLALATPEQLARVFDLDLWRPAAPGGDDLFDADRFGKWLDVMLDGGVATAAAKLAAMDVGLVATALVQHVRIIDRVAVTPFTTLEGDQANPGYWLDDSSCCEVAGYVISPKRDAFLGPITSVLNALADAHANYFDQLMRTCCRLSNSRPEVDALEDLPAADEQAMFDQAFDRQARRDPQGYVTPAQARAFLQTSRQIDLRQRHLPPRDPLTRAYFRDNDHTQAAAEAPAESVASVEAVATLVDLLREAGVMPRTSRPLLEGSPQSPPRLSRVQAHMRFVQDSDPSAYATRNAELAYLANVIAAGATIQSRPVASEEASNAAVAVCNLGLANWPTHWLARKELPEDFLIHHDLVSAFQVGWTVLHEDVCMYAADELLRLLPSLDAADDDVENGLRTLRVRLTKHWRAGSPWHARDALEVIATLDTPAWAALLSLIDQLPTMHAALSAVLTRTTRQVDASAFEFISENAQIQQIREFMQRLPGLLRS
jgi:hypothetical protein